MKLAVVVVGLFGLTPALAGQAGSSSDGRLQLQEQRILTVSNQLAGLQKEGMSLAQERAMTEAENERTEAAHPESSGLRKAMESQLQVLRRQVAALTFA